MYNGFPINCIDLFLCPKDSANLKLISKNKIHKNKLILNGILSCDQCNEKYQIVGGILSFINFQNLDGESSFEMKVRNEYALREKRNEKYLNIPSHAWEMIPTLNLIHNSPNKSILELGCGTGRYTSYISENCKLLVALDFSIESLKITAKSLNTTSNVALIHADITQIVINKPYFDIVFSTLVSNLPSLNHVNKMFQLAINSLNKNGKFVFSTHHYTLIDYLTGNPKSGKYKENNIYRYYFKSKEIVNISKIYFNKIRVKPIYIRIPILGRLKFPVIPLSLFISKIPILRDLGELLLLSACNPIRPKKAIAANKQLV
jgi:SAM-dependent methyltransferase/uncharacterized protein YbaR (Trm112 family)